MGGPAVIVLIQRSLRTSPRATQNAITEPSENERGQSRTQSDAQDRAYALQ